ALGVVIFLLALGVSIALHELGHLYYAKKFGCRVSQYMVGFGPTVWSWRPTRKLAGGRREPGETEYGIKLIPLGGYVKIIGMFPPATKEQERISRGEASGALPLAAGEQEQERISRGEASEDQGEQGADAALATAAATATEEQ